MDVREEVEALIEETNLRERGYGDLSYEEVRAMWEESRRKQQKLILRYRRIASLLDGLPRPEGGS